MEAPEMLCDMPVVPTVVPERLEVPQGNEVALAQVPFVGPAEYVSWMLERYASRVPVTLVPGSVEPSACLYQCVLVAEV